jgi:hypothetical protein
LAVRSISVSTAPGLKPAYASSISGSTPDPRRNFRADTDSTRRSSSAVFPIPASPPAGVDLRDVQIAARHADPRTTMRYDRARKNPDRHPNYILAAYMASGT